MIKKLEAKDIVKLLEIDLIGLPCKKSQFNQFLMQNINNPKILIIGDIEDNDLKAYGAFIDNRFPPLSNSTGVLNIWSKNHKSTHKIAEAAKEWTKEIGAGRGLIILNDEHAEKYAEAFGLKKIANLYEWKVE